MQSLCHVPEDCCGKKAVSELGTVDELLMSVADLVNLLLAASATCTVCLDATAMYYMCVCACVCVCVFFI